MNSFFFLSNISIAFEALRQSRTRTYLTMLGIIIGVAAISFILTLSQSFKNAAFEQVKNLDNNIIVVRPGKDTTGILSEQAVLNYSPLTPYATTTISEQDYLGLTKDKKIAHISPLMLINGNVRSDSKTSSTAKIIATTPSFDETLKLTMRDGQFLDDNINRDTVVIGKQLSIDLFGTDQSTGSRIYLKGRPHTVVGILKNDPRPVGIAGADLNYAAIVSLEDGKSFNQGIAQIQQLNIVPAAHVSQTSLISHIHDKLQKNHGGEDDVSVMTGANAAVISRHFYEFITVLTTIVASVSLIVGGVGIMNIMLVGVAERTREIGVRKSLGASNRHILWQFMIEALIMSIVGGVIGVVVGFGLAATTCLFFQIIPTLHWSTPLIAFAMATGVGVLFGGMPAYRAAQKDPIEALRQHN